MCSNRSSDYDYCKERKEGENAPEYPRHVGIIKPLIHPDFFKNDIKKD